VRVARRRVRREQIEPAVSRLVDRDQLDAGRSTLGSDDRDAIIELCRLYRLR
jgi:hypothetical protein